MLMNTAEQILVIILAAALAVFIAVGIVAAVYIIKLVKSLQILADKANSIADSAESVAAMVRQSVGNLSFLSLFHNITNFIHKKR